MTERSANQICKHFFMYYILSSHSCFYRCCKLWKNILRLTSLIYSSHWLSIDEPGISAVGNATYSAQCLTVLFETWFFGWLFWPYNGKISFSYGVVEHPSETNNCDSNNVVDIILITNSPKILLWMSLPNYNNYLIIIIYLASGNGIYDENIFCKGIWENVT